MQQLAPSPYAPAAPAPAIAPRPTATTTRVRWGRVLPLLAGIALLAFGAWNMSRSDSGSGTATPDVTRSVGGGGTDGIEVPEAQRSAADDEAATTPRTVDPARAAARRTALAAPTAAARARAADARAARAARAARTAAGGGGAGANGELPFTGLETWLAAALGVLLLGVGICVQVHAVRIGMTAMLYRRGILLRPVDCARIAARSDTLARLRVWTSDLLHRLLQEPAREPAFVSARLTRG